MQLSAILFFFYSSHTTYTKMCRLLLIHKLLVSYHNIFGHHPNHCDITSSSVTSSCPLFAAGVVMTPLLMSLTTTKCSWQQMEITSIVGICTGISYSTISQQYLAKSWDNYIVSRYISCIDTLEIQYIFYLIPDAVRGRYCTIRYS